MKLRHWLVVLFLLLPSCSRGGAGGTEGVFSLVPRPSPLHGRLTFDILSDPKTFNPALAQETTSTQVLGYLFRGLTRVSPYDGQIKPDLADRWRIDPSGLRVTFTLEKGLRWSDGVPLTAQDVVFTFNRVYYNPAVAAAVRDILTVDGKPFTVRAIDDRTVVFETAKPFAPLLEELGVEILPEHLLSGAVSAGRFNTAWSVRTPPAGIVGTGPFRLERYVPGQYLLLVRNPLYTPPRGLKRPIPGNLPYLDRVLLRIIPNQNSELLRFLAGKSDLIGVSPAQVPVLSDAAGSRAFRLLVRGPSQAETFLTFNENPKAPIPSYKVAWFRSRRFRQAIAYALDRKALVNVIYNGLGAPIPGPVSPANKTFFNPAVFRYHKDLPRARALLEKDGFVRKNGRLYDASGHPVTILLMTNTESPERISMAQMVQAMLAPLGMRIRVVPLQFNMLSTMVLSSHQWEMLLFGLTGSLDPHGNATVWRSSGFLHLWNPGEKTPSTPWEAEVDRLFDQGVATFDPERRKKIYDRWQEIATREVPMVDLVSPDAITAVRKTLGGIHPTPLGGVIPHISLVTQKARLVIR
ncbi:MAG: ABC transporter substrate-binding protein [Nitrospirae bacterium]|nr:ABC transporter substrate-binding protein [Nitrospirota bacterium]